MTGLPDVRELYADQRCGWTCARCRARLFASVHIGTIRGSAGLLELYACPSCATPEEQAAQEQARSGLCAACDGWAARAVVVSGKDCGAAWPPYAHAECAQERGWKPLGGG